MMAPKIRPRRWRPAQAGRALLLLLAGVWVIVQNNARIIDNRPDDVRYSFLQVPREFRLLEVGIVLATFALLQPRLLRSRLRDLDVLVLAFIVLALTGVAAAPIYPSAQLQGIYLHVAPFLVFAIAWEASPDRRLLRQLILLFSAYIGVSIVVGLFVQFPLFGAKGDWVHGYFSDAHAFGSYLAIGSCVAFSAFLDTGRPLYLIASAALLAVSYYPANEKVIILNAAWIAGSAAHRLLVKPRGWRAWATLGAMALFSVGVAAARTADSEVLIRTETFLVPRISDLGVVRAWSYAWNAIGDSPTTLFAGLGSGNYAGVAATRAVLEQPKVLSRLSPAAKRVLLSEGDATSAVSTTANTWANLLAEFGLVGSAVFLLALGSILVPILRWEAESRYDRHVRTLFLVMLTVVVWQGFFTPYTNWAEQLLVYPMAVVAAYCHRQIRCESSMAEATC